MCFYAVNSSMVSLPFTVTAQANSPIRNTTGKECNLWDHNLDIATSLLSLSQKSLTTVQQYTPTKRNASQNTIEKETDLFNREFKISKPKLDELTEIKLVDDDKNDNMTVKQESTSRRRSISDLVERYKKVLETSNCAAKKFQKECIEHETE